MMGLFVFLMLLNPGSSMSASQTGQVPYRPQKYALYRAHKILPPTLLKIVKINGKFLFNGFEKGVLQPQSRVTPVVIEREKKKITQLINNRAPFSIVITQMGYVGGLLAVFLDPSQTGSSPVRKGFSFYLNYKVPKFLFVFDGYRSLNSIHGGVRPYLNHFQSFRKDQSSVLEAKYSQVGSNPYHVFSEQSAVFGISSVYFSNLASASAHLWYDAWQQANGDVRRTPYKNIQITPISRK